MYDCEIEGCVNKTDGYLCEYHAKEILDDNKFIVICNLCNKIMQIKDKEFPEFPRYIIAEDCMRCRPIGSIDPE